MEDLISMNIWQAQTGIGGEKKKDTNLSGKGGDDGSWRICRTEGDYEIYILKECRDITVATKSKALR